MNYAKIFTLFRAMLKNAEGYDEKQTGDLAEQAGKKADSARGALRKVFAELMDMIRLLKARALGRYKETPWKTMAMATAAVLYFVSPLDVIPDFIPFLGYLDDAFIIGWVMKSIRTDVQKFRQWESNPTVDYEAVSNA